MKSPCVGFCSTTFGDPICRGCKRTIREVDQWNTLTGGEQRQVWQRLWQQTTEVVCRYLAVKDSTLLRQQLQRFAVRHHLGAPPEVWALDLLRAGSEQIRDLSAYGLELLPSWKRLTPAELFNRINAQLWLEAAQAARDSHPDNDQS
ncbi:DUF1289 domain-containing protein [Marinospirillum alkaliphilum]|uniref:DUF1289 domain-containing protein n=1 Tax=Marinospirillum alkaliphilum TaxID=148454 RepID=UPI0015A4FBF1|nr:DUF1289 domain-containing protein [Marinospirillum alkaliphilum]